MSDTALVVLFVLAVALHNLEEGLWLPHFAARLWRAPSAANFRFGVIVLTVLIALVAAWCVAGGRNSLPAYLLAGTVLAMLANIIVPHLLGTLILRRYVPGLATSIALIAPTGALLLDRLVSAGWVEPRTLLWSAPLVVAAIVGLIAALFALGARLFPLRGKTTASPPAR